MAIPAFVALPRENNALPKSAGKNASLKQKRIFEHSPHRAAMSGAVIIAQLIGDDTAQGGQIVVRSRSPVFELCRALLAAGANPNSRLECFRGSILALTVKSIGIGAKLTIRETVTDRPRVVLWKPLQGRDVSAPVR